MVPQDPDAMLVSTEGPEAEHKVLGSRFLGQVFGVTSPEGARSQLDALKRKYYDATHHGSASRWGHEAEPGERFDDDGEPTGTTGTPILNAIRSSGRTDTLVIVTRWYGGTKLGTGGLARAYGEAARLALEASPPRTLWREVVLQLSFAFEDMGTVETLLAKSGESVLRVERTFDPEPRLTLAVKKSRVEALRSHFVEASAGRVRIRD
jgi:uncharacterized YigZ family protein